MRRNPISPKDGPPAAAFAACILFFLSFGLSTLLGESQSPPDYAAVHALFARHCLDCHGPQEPEGGLVLESYEALRKGGDSGPVIVPGQSATSLLVRMVQGGVERDGKKRIMPPGKREKLDPSEIALLKAWIDAGAAGPTGALAARELVVPQIKTRVEPRRPVYSVAWESGAKFVAVGRYGQVELVSEESRLPERVWSGPRGNINALAFTPDGKWLFAAGGEAGLAGEVVQWNVSDGSLVRKFAAHRDTIYAMSLSPDGKILATGSYDQKIKLWNTETGAELRTLSGHNGAVYGLTFRPDGQILASASADRTVKLWDVATGERRDTLSQSLKEVYAVVFSQDGKRLFAAGADNRIREWEISPQALETTNPILESRFAHEGSILKLALSADGKTLLSAASDQSVKLWDTTTLTERLLLEPQPDWPSAAAFGLSDRAVVVGRMDGSLQFYETRTGHGLPRPKPELVRMEPRGVERGGAAKLSLVGKHLVGLTNVWVSDSRLAASLLPIATPGATQAWVNVVVPTNLPPGTYEFSVAGPAGASGKVKLAVDDLPQLQLVRAGSGSTQHAISTVPVSAWGTLLNSGDSDELVFPAGAGQTLVFEMAAARLGSALAGVLTLSDSEGKVLASSNGFEQSPDPLLAFTFSKPGQYHLEVSDFVATGSSNHFYRLSIGSFAFVTGCFPLSVPVNVETQVELAGFNLPDQARVSFLPERPGEFELPLDLAKYRCAKPIKLLVTEVREQVEHEPNDSVSEATPLESPGAISGRFWRSDASTDVDYFRFEAKAGQSWIIETTAAQRGSPADTRIELLDEEGHPLERLALQAVRDSAVTFRGIDSNSADCRVINWEEMDLNQYLYLQGEVVKLFRAPQGPDSGFVFYSAHGKRRCYFNTSPAAHPVDQPCYIVEPRPLGTRLVATGLPVFPLFYENDDDGEREKGSDSYLQFTAPRDGHYLVRVTDSRGFGGPDFAYRLLVRRAIPDFQVMLNGTNLTVNAGSGQSFGVEADRQDGFAGEIVVIIDGLPKGFGVSTPLVIQSDHTEVKGTIYASADAPEPTSADWAKVEVTARASVDGRAVVKAVNNFGSVRRGEKPKVFVALEPDTMAASSGVSTGSQRGPVEITIAPGETLPAWLRVRRNGYDDLLTFTVENLPHGVIVDNIGLNGVLIPKDQNERQIFLTAAKWVPETDRLCYAIENQNGRQTSEPVLLHVRRRASEPVVAIAPRGPKGAERR